MSKQRDGEEVGRSNQLGTEILRSLPSKVIARNRNPGGVQAGDEWEVNTAAGKHS